MSAHATLLSRIGVATLALLAGAAGGCQTRPYPGAAAAAPIPTTGDRVARGRMLVTIGGCHDCHTPMQFDPEVGMPMHDMTRMLSGHPQGAPDPASTLSGHDNGAIGPTFTAFRVPFGLVYAANLTPDKDTGLGAWTEDMFLRAVRTGRHMGGNGRPIVPPMPWPNLAQQSDEDLKSIFAYLRSIPAIRNDVPAPKVPEAALTAIAASYEKAMAKMKGHAAAEAAGATVARK